MTVVGFDGLPKPERAGNVLNSSVKMQISFRIPPLVDAALAAKAVKEAFEKDPPFGAKVTANFGRGHVADGWNAPESKAELTAAVDKACAAYFNGKQTGFVGVGGTIPLMNMLTQMFPDSSLLCTGVIGPGANMHGPNENLDIEYTKKVTASIAMVMGVMESAVEESWPDDVPVPTDFPIRKRTDSELQLRKRTGSTLSTRSSLGTPSSEKRRFCFRSPEVPIGQCACCL